MPDLTKEQLKEAYERFEELGAAAVERLVTSGGFPGHWELPAHNWLTAKKNEKKPS